MRQPLALPLSSYFPPSGYARHSCVTALYLIFHQPGMRDTLALPLPTYFYPSGHARHSCVTAILLFSTERACETLLRYRSLLIFHQAGMRDTLALPLPTYFYPSGHARPLCVTAFLLFSPERACETSLRYHSPLIFSRAGMRDTLALPLSTYFYPSGHARHSCVTALFLFSTKRVCETLLRYHSLLIFHQAGMRDLFALPLSSYFLPSGYARPPCVTALLLFSTERACETSQSNLSISISLSSETQYLRLSLSSKDDFIYQQTKCFIRKGTGNSRYNSLQTYGMYT